MPQIRVQNADKVPGEVRGHDQGGIVFAGADALQASSRESTKSQPIWWLLFRPSSTMEPMFSFRPSSS